MTERRMRKVDMRRERISGRNHFFLVLFWWRWWCLLGSIMCERGITESGVFGSEKREKKKKKKLGATAQGSLFITLTRTTQGSLSMLA